MVYEVDENPLVNKSLLGHDLTDSLPHVPVMTGDAAADVQQLYQWALRMKSAFTDILSVMNTRANIGFLSAVVGANSVLASSDGVLTITDSGGSTVSISGSAINISSYTLLSEMGGDLDDVSDGSTYGRVALSNLTGSIVQLDQCGSQASWASQLTDIPTRFADAVPASGAGLILTADAMGYYKAGKKITEQWTSGTFVVGEEVDQATTNAKGIVYEATAYAEIVTNGDMELDANWDDSGTPTTNERSDVQKHGGTYSRKFEVDASGEGIQQGSLTMAAATYRLTFWVYPDDTTAVAVKVFDGGGNKVYDTNSTGLVQDSWNEVNIDFTSTAAGSSGRVDLLSTQSSGVWYIDDVSIKRHDELAVVVLSGTFGASNIITGQTSSATVNPSAGGDIAGYTTFGMLITSSGDFYFAGDGDNYIAWDGTNINIFCGGGFIGSSTDYFNITEGKLHTEKSGDATTYLEIYEEALSIVDSSGTISLSAEDGVSFVGLDHNWYTRLECYSTTVSKAARLVLYKSDSNSKAKVETDSGDHLGSITFYGTDSGSTYGFGADIDVKQTAASTATACPSEMSFTIWDAAGNQVTIKLNDNGLDLDGENLVNAVIGTNANEVQGALRVDGNNLECYLNGAWRTAASG